MKFIESVRMELDRVNFTTLQNTTKSGVHSLTAAQYLVYTYGAMHKKDARILSGIRLFLKQSDV